jgi:hypothetical protein
MPGDVVDLITQDHREVERLFDELTENPEKRPNLLPVLTTLLTAQVLPGMRANLSEQRRAELGEAFAASRKQHLGEQPGDMTKDQLAQQATNADLSGTSGLTKDQLQKKVEDAADR